MKYTSDKIDIIYYDNNQGGKTMNPELEPYYDKNISCPMCETSYKTRKIRTRFSNPHQIDADFCPHYKNPETNPLYYLINVCPQCGYSFNEQFSENFSDKAKATIWDKICKSWKQLDFTKSRTFKQAVDSYKLAIYCAEYKEEKPEVLGGICLRLAWLYRGEKDIEQEKRFLQLALKKYDEAFLKSDSLGENMSESTLLYMIGELNRRLGNHTEAIRNFSRVINHVDKEKEKKMVRMAREQWAFMREKKLTEEEIPEIE